MGGSRGKRPSKGDRHASSAGLSDESSRGLSGGSPRGQSWAPTGPHPGYLPRFFVESPQPTDPPSAVPLSPTAVLGHEVVLGPEDAHHATRVLRLGLGDPCEVVVIPADLGGDQIGATAGAAYLASVTSATDEVRVTTVARLHGRQAGAAYAIAVGIVQAVARPAAMDFLVEKATEVGASFILAVAATGSSYRPRSTQGARLTRWRRIAREASKQSKQLAVPSVEFLGSSDEALERLGAGTLSFILDPAAPDGLCEVLSSASWGPEASVEGAQPVARPARVALWVGPESGWTAEESTRLTAAGALTVRLGRSVLRTETAGPVAVAVARLALGDW